MIDKEKVIKALELEIKYPYTWDCKSECPYYSDTVCDCYTQLATDAIELLKEQEPRELTKKEWEQWKKDERRDPICMIFYGDTTPFWKLRPESINEPLYLMGKIKLFTKKPLKGQVKWDAAD